MIAPFTNVLLFGSIAGLATIAGILLVLYKEQWVRKHSLYLAAFAAGVLLAAAFFDIIPESIELAPNAILWTFVGFLALYLLEHVLLIHTCHDKKCERHNLGVTSIAGIGFHSLLDGIAIAAGFEVSTSLGIVAAISVILHELPEGISALSLLIHSGFERKNAILLSVLVALATPIGAVVAWPFLSNISPAVLGALLGITAGSFIYIAAADLIPEVHGAQSHKNAFVFLAGIAFVFLITAVL